MRIFFAVITFLLSLSTALAQNDFSPLSLVGRWSITAQHPDGTPISVNVVLTQNQKFTSTTAAQGKPFNTATGTWAISGRTLTWRYDAAPGSTSNAAVTDSDEIISADADKLVLRSKLSGKQQEYLRVK